MTVDLQTCGHPVACIEGRTTLHCSMCALIAERAALKATAATVAESLAMLSDSRSRKGEPE